MRRLRELALRHSFAVALLKNPIQEFPPPLLVSVPVAVRVVLKLELMTSCAKYEISPVGLMVPPTRFDEYPLFCPTGAGPKSVERLLCPSQPGSTLKFSVLSTICAQALSGANWSSGSSGALIAMSRRTRG